MSYKYWDGTSKAVKIPNQQRKRYHEEDTLTNDVTKLKTYLFIEQRRHHRWGWAPSEEEMVYIKALIENIRSIESQFFSRFAYKY